MMDSYAQEFNYKIVNDPIYGCINLSKTEVELLDTRAMQRLRRIRQMGFSSYVFPSGEHSRFVHSLGVLYITGKMCEHLYGKYGVKQGDIEFSLEDAKKVRIAALLHDVGHFPFSHLSECVYSYIDNEEMSNKLIDGFEGDISSDELLLSDIANYAKRKDLDHEHIGALVIQKDPEIVSILKKAKIDPDEIGNIIIGDTQAKPVYAQLLHSSLDADRLDYLLRDSQQAGVSFGHVEFEYILRQMRIVEYSLDKEGGDNAKIQLIVFDIRAQHAIEHFLMARFFHYTQVVQHKTAVAFEAIAKSLLYKVLKGNDNKYSNIDQIKSIIGTEDYYRFTDDYIWQIMDSFCSENQDPFISALWQALNQRKKPMNVLTMTDIIPKKKGDAEGKPCNDTVYFLSKWLIQNEKKELLIDINIKPDFVGYVESKIHLESIPSHFKAEDCSLENLEDGVRGAIRIIDKEGKISFLASDNKSLINKMVDFTSNTLDIFVIGDVEQGAIEALRKKILMRARQ